MKSYKEWSSFKQITENTSLNEWVGSNYLINEGVGRYSIEVNFRTKMKEVLNGYAKIALGYVSAALKQSGYHIKHVYDEEPVRILVSASNWVDGTWVGIVLFNPEHDGGSFIICKGFYNKDVKTISMQNREKCKGDSAAEITTELKKMMDELKHVPDRHLQKLKAPKQKRGPK